jgi:hypothetical protein
MNFLNLFPALRLHVLIILLFLLDVNVVIFGVLYVLVLAPWNRQRITNALIITRMIIIGGIRGDGR